MSEEIYRRAIKELWERTYGTLEDRDRIKVAELFDKLLDRGHSIHVDEVRRLCKDAGYDEYVCDRIGHLYDTLILFREKLRDPRTLDHWPENVIEDIVKG